MVLSFMRDTVTVLRPAAKTERGSTVPDWANATSATLTGVQVTAASTSEDRDGRVDNAADKFTLRAPYEADIQSGDRVEWNGVTYEVDGDVFHTKSPTGRVSSTRCALVAWKG